MPETFRVASFNVENLFSRAKILNLRNSAVISGKLKLVDELNTLIHKPTRFTQSQQDRIVELYDELKTYITIRENRGTKLFNRTKTKVVAKSGADWEGEIAFTRERFSELARENTAKVIKSVKADILCVVEAEDRLALTEFDRDALSSRYPYEMLIDGNDRRGIDVGIYSRFPLGGVWTHIFDKAAGKPVFSRDCPEYEVFLPNGTSLFVLCNHFKSKGYSAAGTADARRKTQAKAVADILAGYDLANDLVIVAGDLNDTPSSAPLAPLLGVSNLTDVLALQFANPKERWTYSYRKTFEQIDYLLVSKPLKESFEEAGVERRGIFNLKHLTTQSQGTPHEVPVETEWDTVAAATAAASDHGAVWADFWL